MYVSVAACEREILKGKVGAKRECVKGKSCKGRGCVLGHDVCDSPGVHRLAVALLLFCCHIEEQEALTLRLFPCFIFLFICFPVSKRYKNWFCLLLLICSFTQSLAPFLAP